MNTSDLDKQINNLDQIAESMMRKFNNYLLQSSSIDLTPVQQYLLKVLKQNGKSTPSEIAHHMGVTSGAVTSLTDRLCKQDYIVRERSEEDRRLVIIRLTTKGEKIAKLAEQERMSRLRKIFSSLKPGSIENLTVIYSDLDKVLSSLIEE